MEWSQKLANKATLPATRSTERCGQFHRTVPGYYVVPVHVLVAAYTVKILALKRAKTETVKISKF